MYRFTKQCIAVRQGNRVLNRISPEQPPNSAANFPPQSPPIREASARPTEAPLNFKLQMPL